MSGVLRLGNTGAGTGRSTLEASASNDQTFTLPSAGGTLLTSNTSIPGGTITLDGATINITNGDLNVDSGTLFVDESTNRVGIGTTSPVYTLDVQGTDAALRLKGNSNTGFIADQATSGLVSLINYDPTGDLRLGTASTEQLRIDSSGRLLIGRSTNFTGTNSQYGLLQISGNSAGSAGDGRIVIGRGEVPTAANQSLGQINFVDNTAGEFASIKAFTDGACGTDDYPGRIEFHTTADGASSPTERMRIDSAGRVGIGATSPGSFDSASNQLVIQNSGNCGITIDATSSTDSNIYFADGDQGNERYRGTITYSHSVDAMRFGTGGGNEAMRIDSSGRVLVGTNSGQGKFVVEGSLPKIQSNYNGTKHLEFGVGNSGCGFVMTTDHFMTFNHQPYANRGSDINLTERMRIDNNGRLSLGTTSNTFNSIEGKANFFQAATNLKTVINCVRIGTTSGRNQISFHNPNGNVGNISTSGSSTTYGTSSDYRLKENVVPLTNAADRLNQLQVRRFNFIADPDTTVDGFIAHETQAVVPEAVTGTHDEVDDDGKPVYQGIDQSKLVPLLTAALQETIAKVEALEAEVSKLRSN